MTGKELKLRVQQTAELIERHLQDLEDVIAEEGFHVDSLQADFKKLTSLGSPTKIIVTNVRIGVTL